LNFNPLYSNSKHFRGRPAAKKRERVTGAYPWAMQHDKGAAEAAGPFTNK